MADEAGAGEQFPLADLIETIGKDLREAERRGGRLSGGGRFNLTEVTVELGITWEKTGTGGLEFWVVKLGGGLTKANTQTIVVRLEPVGDDMAMGQIDDPGLSG